MVTTVSVAAWVRVDDRAQRAGLALGAWVGLLADEVAAGVPVVSEAQLEALVAARVRVARIGGAVNQVAVGEHMGREVSEAELVGVLDRVRVRVEQANTAVAEATAVFDRGPVGDREVASGGMGRGRRAQVRAVGQPRERVVRVGVTPVERARLTTAAGRDGLAVGAWLGLLLEDPQASRPLRGEAWGAAFALRRALRRVATNLAQIESVRAARDLGVPGLVGQVAGEVDAAIRACLDLAAAISDPRSAGVVA